MKVCNECGVNIDCSRQKVHKTLCVTCYRRKKREKSLLNNNSICLTCNINSSTKWYSNKTQCRNCYRKSVNKKGTEQYKIERIKNNLRSRISKIVSGKVKLASAVTNLGCTIEEFRIYIEKQFKLGMSWDNYGHKTWHIDHIKSLYNFDLTKKEQLLEACHYTNLRPLWAKENLVKGSKNG
jgi:hypothetical protein